MFIEEMITTVKKGFNSQWEFETFFSSRYAHSPHHLLNSVIIYREAFASSTSIDANRVKEVKAQYSIADKAFKVQRKLLELCYCSDNLDSEKDKNMLAKCLRIERPMFITQELSRRVGVELLSYGRIRPESADILISLPRNLQEAVLSASSNLRASLEQTAIINAVPRKSPIMGLVPTNE
jgi:hypothetical protein